MNKELLVKICRAHGVTGDESGISSLILDEIKEYIDDFRIDALGNLIAHKKGPGKKMMLAGHMDQIGLMITGIDKEGFLYFSNIGGFTLTVLAGQRMVFKSGLRGVVSYERITELKDLTPDKMYIDIGARSKEEAEKLVSVGDVCTYDAQALIDDFKLLSPAVDDRIGCFIMIETLKRLKDCKYDLYLVFTVQEEIGLRGARASAFSVDPDYGIAYDVTTSADTPKAIKMPQKMGEGVAIKIKDSSVICHPDIVRHMESCAKEAGIKHQFEILEHGGTDSGAIHVTRGGVPSGVISISTRYIHSPNEMCMLSDIEEAIKLSVKVLETEISPKVI